MNQIDSRVHVDHTALRINRDRSAGLSLSEESKHSSRRRPSGEEISHASAPSAAQINHSDGLGSDFASLLFQDGPLADIKLRVRKSFGKFENMRGANN